MISQTNLNQVISLPDRYPEEILDYYIAWDKRLAGDTIISSSFIAQSNSTLIVSANTYSNTSSTVWLSGGTSKTISIVKNTVVTLNGRTMEIMLKIKTL